MMQMITDAAMSLLAPAPLLAIFLGTLGGIIIGAIPGLTATMAVALLIPVTFGMNPVVGLALMGGVYSGGMFGGAISSILLSTPGTPAAAATAGVERGVRTPRPRWRVPGRGAPLFRRGV